VLKNSESIKVEHQKLNQMVVLLAVVWLSFWCSSFKDKIVTHTSLAVHSNGSGSGISSWNWKASFLKKKS